MKLSIYDLIAIISINSWNELCKNLIKYIKLIQNQFCCYQNIFIFKEEKHILIIALCNYCHQEWTKIPKKYHSN